MNNMISELIAQNFTNDDGSVSPYGPDDRELYTEIQHLLDIEAAKENSVEYETVFDSPGLTIGYLSCAWIHEGDLYTYNTATYSY